MITVTVKEICQACFGRLLSGVPSTGVQSISTDTRDDLEGKLFVALAGEHFDGGEFVEEAVRGGALGVVAEKEAAERLAAHVKTAGAGESTPVIISVEDSGGALKKISSLAAAKIGATVVAVTGSTGKTSTKDILAGLAGSQIRTVANKASFNNEVGVPLTLLSATPDTEVIVVEMGMQAPGEINELCRIVSPDIAIITNVGPSHLEFSGSLENVARGKAELANNLKPGGGLVIPYGDKLLEPHVAGLDARLVTFGFDGNADIHPVKEEIEDGRLHCIIDCRGERAEFHFNFTARHQLLNTMAALAACQLIGLSLESLVPAAESIRMSSLRGELIELPEGSILINDCYNANPLSMESALEYLVDISAGGRSVAILGDMGELGPGAAEYHRQAGRKAAELGIDCLVCVGELALGYIEGAGEVDDDRQDYHFPDCERALKGISGLVRSGDAILIKASRFMGLERLSVFLAGPGAGHTGFERESD